MAVRSSTGSDLQRLRARARRSRQFAVRLGGGTRRRYWRFLRCLHLADKAKTFPRDGADDGLIPAAVADRLSRRVDPAGQGRFRNDPAIPDIFDQIVLGDDALAIFDQINQQIEDLRLDRDALAAARSARGGRRQAHDWRSETARCVPGLVLQIFPARTGFTSLRPAFLWDISQENQDTLKAKSVRRQSHLVRPGAVSVHRGRTLWPHHPEGDTMASTASAPKPTLSPSPHPRSCRPQNATTGRMVVRQLRHRRLDAADRR